jgi:hypothetical protein
MPTFQLSSEGVCARALPAVTSTTLTISVSDRIILIVRRDSNQIAKRACANGRSFRVLNTWLSEIYGIPEGSRRTGPVAVVLP